MGVACPGRCLNLSMMMEHAAVLIVSLVASAIDVRTRRIPNWLTFGAAAAAIAWHLFAEGPRQAGFSVVGWVVAVACFVPVFAVGGLGAGDVKLVGAIGAWLGPAAAFHVVLYSAIAGGVMALIVASARGYLRSAFSNVRVIVTSWFFGIRTIPGLTLEDSTGPRLAYAIPIAAGTMVTLWLQ
jgi:prepilin peptidase CpaA